MTSVAPNWMKAALGSALLRGVLPGGEPIQSTLWVRPLGAAFPWGSSTADRARTLDEIGQHLISDTQYVPASITSSGWTFAVDNSTDQGRAAPASAIEIAARPGASFSCSGIVVADDASLQARIYALLRFESDEIIAVAAGDVLSLLPADL